MSTTPTLPSTDRPRTRPVRPSETHLVQADPTPRRRAARVLVAAGLIAIVATFSARCSRTAWDDAITSDESTHLIHCLHYWMTGDDLAMWELGAPRLPHALNALASYTALRGTGLLPVEVDPRARAEAISRLVHSGNNRVLVPARMVAIASGVTLLLAVFWAVARRHGAPLGLVAAGVTSLVPEVIAHSSIAGSDVPFTASAFLALVFLSRYVERPGPRRWAALGLAIGLAWAMRHTALLLLMMAGISHLVVRWRAIRPKNAMDVAEVLGGSVLAGVALGAIAFAVLWAGDGLGTITLTQVSERAMTLSVPRRVGPLDVSNAPIPTSLLSIVKQVRHQNQGHEAYLCGAIRDQGWSLYFPLAFLLKTPVGFLLLMTLAVALVRPEGAWDYLVVGFLALLWLMLVRNKVNIGVRYALLTYPLAAMFIARLFARHRLRDPVWGPLTLAAAGWLAFASFACEGRALSYFNEIGGGPSRGWIYLADSNIDWGQDLNRLARAVPALGIRDITTDISSNRSLEVPGVQAVANPSRAFQVPAVRPPNRRLYDGEGNYLPVYTRYVAVSVSRLLGLYSQNDMSWLRTRKLVARVGDSVFVFDMDTPADRPFCE